MTKVGLGEDQHQFIDNKPLILAGIIVPFTKGLAGNSDADVVLHAITNALCSITTKPILGNKADELCANGIKNSDAYLQIAYQDLLNLGFKISHIAISIEAKNPHLEPHFLNMRKNIAKLLDINSDAVGITATSGEGLSDYGRGLGMKCLALVTVYD